MDLPNELNILKEVSTIQFDNFKNEVTSFSNRITSLHNHIDDVDDDIQLNGLKEFVEVFKKFRLEFKDTIFIKLLNRRRKVV